MEHMECDVLVAGSGAGGLSAAIVMAKAGLDVLVVEKADLFGGTTALSGGVLWIPGNRWDPQKGEEARVMARRYLNAEAGETLDSESVEQFLKNAPHMVEWFERETCVRFVPTQYPDYHPDQPGGAVVGRSILAQPFDIRALGDDMARLRPPLKTITFMGMMFNSSNADLKHFFQATTSLTSFIYVAKRFAPWLVRFFIDSDLKNSIRTIADYPKPGIMFRDITTLLGSPHAFRRAVDMLVQPWAGLKIDKVAGVEARGFILGGAVALDFEGPLLEAVLLADADEVGAQAGFEAAAVGQAGHAGGGVGDGPVEEVGALLDN